MATTEVIPNGIFVMKYTAVAIPHIARFRVTLNEDRVIGTSPTIKAFSGGGADRESSDFGTYLWSKIGTDYNPADNFDSYEVYDVTTTPPTFIYSATADLPGTQSGADVQRPEGGVTIVFRDAAAKKVHFSFLGSVNGGLYRFTGGVHSEFQTFIDEFALPTTPGNLGDYITGRSGEKLIQFMSKSGGANNALEKKILFG